MNINYRILSVDEKNHSFLVRYWTDIVDENSLAGHFDSNNNIIMDANGYPVRCRTDYNITCYNSLDPSSDDVLNLIKRTTPLQFFHIQENMKTGNLNLSLANVISMIGQSNTFYVPPPNSQPKTNA
jgi:hypothetical protein